MSTRFVAIACGVAAALLMPASAPALAQEYPSKPIRIIVANTAGSTVDILARVMAPEMAKAIGQPMIVENRPGANATIGLEYIAKQVPADGYVLLATAVTALASLPVSVKELRFDPLKDLPPLIGMVEGPYILGSPASVAWRNFNEFVAYAKANPGKLNYGSPAPTVQLPMEALIREIGLDIVHVPYPGGAPYNRAVLSNEVQLGLMLQSAVASFGDRFRAIAVTGSRRLAAYPDVPTFNELGYPQIRGLAYSLNVPAATPRPAFDKLYAAAVKAIRVPEVRTRFTGMGFEIVEQPPEVAAKGLADEARFLAEVAKKIGFKPQ